MQREKILHRFIIKYHRNKNNLTDAGTIVTWRVSNKQKKNLKTSLINYHMYKSPKLKYKTR